MPNSFIQLDVPQIDGPGTPTITSGLDRSKTLVFSGPVRGRYVVEGSNDGGATWDILIDDDGAQALFTTVTPGVRSFDCVVQRIRVRSIGNGQSSDRPTISLGAQPAIGVPIFGVLDVPAAPGLGAPFDLGLSAGPFKTFILRGAIPAGARYTVLGSIDGQRFDEAFLFTSDQQGARPVDFLCRFLRVQRASLGATPVISFGSEGVLEPGDAGGTTTAADLSIAEPGLVATSSPGDEEVFRQYRVPLGALAAPAFVATLAGESPEIPGGEAGALTFRVRKDGAPDQPDGDVLLSLQDRGGDRSLIATSAAIPRPDAASSTLIKVTGQGNGANRASLRNFVLLFHSP